MVTFFSLPTSGAILCKDDCCDISACVFVPVRFGHQDSVAAIDCMSKERPVTAGTTDRTLRVWKVLEESQLVFNGHRWCGCVGVYRCG